MNVRRRSRFPVLATIFVVAVIVTCGTIFLINKNIRFVTKTGEVIYDESLSEEQVDFLQNIFADKKLKHDVIISSNKTLHFYGGANELLYKVEVPVGDFYDPRMSVSKEEVLSDEVDLVSFENLDATQRALAIDGDYFLDSLIDEKPHDGFETYPLAGAVFHTLVFDSKDAQEIKNLVAENLPKLPSASEILSINQTGVTALTRQMQNKLNAVGSGAYFADKIKDFLSRTDITHTSNEVSFADDCTNTIAMAFCADPRMFDTLSAIGVDVVELTGNHNNDWGAAANLATLKKYEDEGILTVGGGENENAAAVPLEINEKNTHITWLAVNESTSTKANSQGATEDRPGANIYDEDLVASQIRDAKAHGDFVIVDVQYFECYSYPEDGEEMPSCDLPITGQEDFFKHLVDLGADMVVGTQAHQPQTFEIYNGKPIYYGLGNLFFDQIYWPGTRRSLILTHYFYHNKLLQTRITPTIYDNNYQTAIMPDSDAVAFLSRLTSYFNK